MNEPAVAIAQVAGTLPALSIVVLEICKALPDEGRTRVRQQLEHLRISAVDGESGFAAFAIETCDKFLSEI